MRVPPNLILASACALTALARADEPQIKPVSYYKEIRPLFQAQCQGCHQPAKAQGGYVMTDFKKLVEGGESAIKGEKAIIATDPDHSLLVSQITPANGEPEMPKKKPPLPSADIQLIRRWIVEGATDDTPANARQRFDNEHPPVYTRPATVTSLDFSPDGQLLAVTGFQEVLLHKTDGSGLAGRLVGLSQRIESARFSPDGKWLAAAGGQPARMGEVQIWDVAKRKLAMSVPVTFDTVYGVSWSPDSKTVAFGCSDKTVRAIDAATGQQVLQLSTHSDWVLDTVFSFKGDHVISVSRDMSAKLTEFASQRFVDNITSITPGALRGGIHAVARHPKRDEILIGGADGVPQAYRVFRTTARKIGDDATHIRQFPAMEGRIYSVGYSPDGTRMAAGSSLDGKGHINICTADYDDKLPPEIEKLLTRDVKALTGNDSVELEKYLNAGVQLLHSIPFDSGIYALAFSADGKTLAASGEDGKVRLIDIVSGTIVKEFIPVPIGTPGLAESLPTP
ncbi:MAG: repeat protein [Chthoniobacteraceae bacterium]|nr:repeat protein [Chthoniobacteraceae bacterium]